MLRHERLSAVLELLAARGRLAVDDIAAAFDISPATVRRDLDDLASQQLVARTRGGAVAQSVTYDLPLRYKSVRQSAQKQRIAAAAAALVQLGTVVGLNGGTTNSEVARNLATRADLATGRGATTAFTVVTNALNIANELTVRPHIKIVVPGGVARPQSYELIGPLANNVLEDLTIDILFLGVDALSPVHGAAAAHEGEARINRMMVDRARQVVAVADSSKLGARAFCRICETSSLDVIITDIGVDAETVAQFRAKGVEVQLV
ncbi:MAG: DeoR family transcriptional regulator [Pseudonocardiales bacterium]|jgi:DeoR family transcriptional regulator of aga operon|nr:DeoR family transcriptional regulator [Pseudonocardiales bacterium]